MFRKVHYRLTFLCAGITIFILIIMSLIYLYVSESGLKKNQFLSFQRDMSTLTANLEQQTVITHEWLSKIEKNNSYLVSIMDNGISFLFNDRNQDVNKSRITNEALNYYHSHFSMEGVSSDYSSYHMEYEFTDSAGDDYYACFAVIPFPAGDVQALILSPSDRLDIQIKEQRVRFLLLDAAAVLLLFLFSYFFTKRLLLPIEKNRIGQIQFVASASHELKTPLAVILSCANACKKASPEEEEVFLSTIRSEGQRMSRLIDDMLFLSKADNHSFHVHMEETEIDTLLLNSYEAFEPMAKEKNIRFQVSLPENAVPACCTDGERLHQIIAILLHNAISYTPPMGRVILALTLEEADSKTSGKYYITVTDNGIGIPEEEKDNIFKRFYRGDKSRSSKNHFGLGLSIASEIITALNGAIQVTDTEGGGSTFTVTIPMRHPAPS